MRLSKCHNISTRSFDVLRVWRAIARSGISTRRTLHAFNSLAFFEHQSWLRSTSVQLHRHSSRRVAQQVQIHEHTMELGERLGLMLPCDTSLSAEELWMQMEREDYLLVRGLVDPSLIRNARSEIRSQLCAEGTIVDDAMKICALGLGEDYHLDGISKGLQRMPNQHLEELGSSLRSFFDKLFQEPSVPSDWKRLRPIPPEQNTGFHLDSVYMGKGSPRCLTCWIPLMDISLDLGGLIVVQGSHRGGGAAELLRRTYGLYDIDQAEVLGRGELTFDPWEALQYGSRYFEEGDAVIFPMHTLHGSSTNTTGTTANPARMRLSMEVRYQPAADRQDDRWFGPPPWGYRVATYEKRHSLVDGVTMQEKKITWGLPTVEASTKEWTMPDNHGNQPKHD